MTVKPSEEGSHSDNRGLSEEAKLNCVAITLGDDSKYRFRFILYRNRPPASASGVTCGQQSQPSRFLQPRDGSPPETGQRSPLGEKPRQSAANAVEGDSALRPRPVDRLYPDSESFIDDDAFKGPSLACGKSADRGTTAIATRNF